MDSDEVFSHLLHDSAARADPFAVYAALRAAPPVFRSKHGYYLATSYAACRTILLSESVSNAVPMHRWWGLASKPITPVNDRQPAPGSMHVLDGVDHKNARRFFAPLFSAKNMSELEPGIRDRLTRSFEQVDGRYDFMKHVAFPTVGAAVAALMSIPEEDVGELVSVARGKGPALEPLSSLEAIQHADRSRWLLEEYFDRAVSSVWHKRGDFLSRLGDIPGQSAMTKPVLVANAQLVFSAGLETTAFFLGNVAEVLYSDRELLARYGEERIRHSIEEFLRLDGSAQFTLRRTIAPLTVAGVTIPAQELIVLLVGAANRDPAQFGDPESRRLDRPRPHHLTFVGGPHMCLGAPLARLVASIVVEQVCKHPATILDIVPNGRLANRGPEMLWLAPA